MSSLDAIDSPQVRPRRPADTPIVSSLGTEPWKAAWWKPAQGEAPTFFYIITIHILAAIGLVFFTTPGWRVILATVTLAWLGALGTTVCYHRSLAHTALRLHPVVKHTLIFFAMFNGSPVMRHCKRPKAISRRRTRHGFEWWICYKAPLCLR